MEVNREDFRAMIFYDFKIGLTKDQSCLRLRAAFGSKSPAKATVYRWFRHFQRCQEPSVNEERTGRPVSLMSDDSVFQMKQILKEDNRATYAQIQASLKIGSSAAKTVLHDTLRVRKLCGRWIPYRLTDEQKEARIRWCRSMLDRFSNGSSDEIINVITTDESWIYRYETSPEAIWVFPDETFPTTSDQGRAVEKIMVCSLFGATGHIDTVLLEEESIRDVKWYTTVSLARVFEKLRNQMTDASKTIILHHNTTLHSAEETVTFFNESGIPVLAHPPFSPDLAPFDFFLFPKAKKCIRGKRFESPAAAVTACKEFLNGIPKEEWKVEIDEWFDRIKSCIQRGGEYCDQKCWNFNSDSSSSPVPKPRTKMVSSDETGHMLLEEGVTKKEVDSEQDIACTENLNKKEHQNVDKDEDQDERNKKKKQMHENEKNTVVGQYEMVAVKIEHFEDEQEASELIVPDIVPVLPSKLASSEDSKVYSVPKTNGMSDIRIRSLKMLQDLIQTPRKQVCNSNIEVSRHGADINSTKQESESDESNNGTESYPKPSYSYPCLIAIALKNSPSGTLTVAKIYNFMCEHFPYFRTAPSGWRNTVMTSLSKNKYFVKCRGTGNRRKGCHWTIAPGKMEKLNETLQKWSKQDSLAIKRAMIYPDHLELLQSGKMKYWKSMCLKNKFQNTQDSSDEDVKDQFIHDRVANNSVINYSDETDIEDDTDTSDSCRKKQKTLLGTVHKRCVYQPLMGRRNAPLLLRDSISNCTFVNID